MMNSSDDGSSGQDTIAETVRSGGKTQQRMVHVGENRFKWNDTNQYCDIFFTSEKQQLPNGSRQNVFIHIAWFEFGPYFSQQGGGPYWIPMKIYEWRKQLHSFNPPPE